MLRLALVGIPALGLVAVAVLVGLVVRFWAYPPHPVPQEPIAFDHSVHAGNASIDCGFCHRTATQAGTAGYPDVQQCMFCHQVISQSTLGAPGIGLSTEQASAEIAKVQDAWKTQRPIDWERIHRVPDHVRFIHEAHITAGFTCATCHGNVEQVGQVVQVRDLRMNDCVFCHRQNSAPTECATCHK
jgi:hypothetical protein